MNFGWRIFHLAWVSLAIGFFFVFFAEPIWSSVASAVFCFLWGKAWMAYSEPADWPPTHPDRGHRVSNYRRP